MARSRIVKPEFFDDEKLARVSRDCRLTFVGLWTLSDDYGIVKGHPIWLRNHIYPYDDISPDEFEMWINSLANEGFLKPLAYHNELFYLIKNFSKHQKVDHPSKARNIPGSVDIDTLSRDFREDSRDFRVETETETETEYKIFPQKEPVFAVDEVDEEPQTQPHEVALSNNGKTYIGIIGKKKVTLKGDLFYGFERFWNAFDYRKGKAEAAGVWFSLKPDDELMEKIIEAAQAEADARQGIIAKGNTPKWAQGWLTSRRWEDEPVECQPEQPTFDPPPYWKEIN